MIEIKPIVSINKENILDRVLEEDVFAFYIQRDPRQGYRFTNPLRDDLKADCSFYRGKNNRLFFHDIAMGEHYDIFRIVQELYNLSFFDALVRINRDFNLRLGTKNPKNKVRKETYVERRENLLQVIPKPFTEDELAWWAEYGISEDTLHKFGVYSVSRVYLNKTLVARSTKKNPIYAYNFPFSNHVKIYRPFVRKESDKWSLSSTTKEDIFGAIQLPFLGDLIIVTSSLKDVMALYELGYTSIAPQGEFTLVDMSNYEGMFDNTLVFMDNDGEFKPPKGKSGKGKQASLQHAKEYDCDFILIPDDEPKDISDYIKKYGKAKAKRLMKKLIDKPLKYQDYVYVH